MPITIIIIIFLGKNKEIIDAELWAILIGLESAEKITLDTDQKPITIFSNSRDALKTISQLIIQKILELKRKSHSVKI